MSRKCVGGFVTIEYTLLIPILLILYTFLVCMGLYQYNQCILCTNIRILGTEGAQMIEESSAERVRELQEIEKKLYLGKYILAEGMQTIYQAQGNHVKIVGRGVMGNPLAVFGIGTDKWDLYAECDVTVINPADTLRVCKAVKNIVQNSLSEEEGKDDS